MSAKEAAKPAATKPAVAPAVGKPATLGVKTSPTDVGIAVRPGAIDLKAKRLPQSIGVTLPVVGSVRIDLAVNVNKATEAEVAASDVVVSLPKDLVKAGKLAAAGTAGAAVDVPGLVQGSFGLDLSTPRKGEADITVTSQLIPQLPLANSKGLGRFCFECGDGNEPSDWFVARNLGNGVQFYGNAKTGQSQFEVPKGF